MRDKIYVEKYRPKTIEDTILPKQIKEQFIQFRDTENIPNLLLSGPPGIGKTTIAKALLRELDYDYILINGSDAGDSGTDAFRTKIKAFASSKSLDGKRKFVIIDESDYLGASTVMPILREFLERFSSNCGFIFTCNYKNRIIEPLQSRLSNIDFHIPKEERPDIFKQFHKRVSYILENEGIQFDKKVIGEFIVKHFPDFRRVINELQKYSVTGTIDNTILQNIEEENIVHLYEIMKKKNFNEMRKWVAENIDMGSNDIFRRLFETLNDYLKPQSIPGVIVILADYQYKNAFVADEQLNMTAALVEIMADTEWK